MNASTFTARVIASTGADVPAAISGAIGAMSGPLHGGAPSRVLGMIEEIGADRRRRRLCPQRAGLQTSASWASATACTAPRTRAPGCCGAPPKELDAPRYEVAVRWSAPRWPSCASGARTACSRPTWSSGRRSCSTTPRSPAHVHVDVHLRPAGRLERTRAGAEAHRPPHPPQRPLHRPGTQPPAAVEGWDPRRWLPRATTPRDPRHGPHLHRTIGFAAGLALSHDRHPHPR